MSSESTDLCLRPAVKLVEMLRRGEISAVELTRMHLERIDRYDGEVNAVVTRVPERALEQAAGVDAAIAAGENLGPLAGLPVAHKDTHDTAGIRTTYGSRLFADHVPDIDEAVIERLGDAGAVTLGKTNVPEFAAGSHTFNEVFGTTRNPYDLSRSAGGSSGGAAAALACGMTALADGSDMGGSLRNPASFCNVVGLRTTPGRVPTFPEAEGWATMSVQGPMGRTVADVALMLSAMAGPHPRSAIALPELGAVFAGPLPGDLGGLRVAWAPDLGGDVAVDADVLATLESCPGVFEQLGCVVEPACPDLSGAHEVFTTVRAHQFASGLGPIHDANPGVLKAALAWNIELGRALGRAELQQARERHQQLRRRVDAFFQTYDVLLAPVSQVAPFDASIEYPRTVAGKEMPTYLDWMRSCDLISATGCPALSVPAGFTTGGLPVGLQVVGPRGGELGVLRAGYAFEQATAVGMQRPGLLAQP
ncbi:amidase [soil metagenome]